MINVQYENLSQAENFPVLGQKFAENTARDGGITGENVEM